MHFKIRFKSRYEVGTFTSFFLTTSSSLCSSVYFEPLMNEVIPNTPYKNIEVYLIRIEDTTFRIDHKGFFKSLYFASDMSSLFVYIGYGLIRLKFTSTLSAPPPKQKILKNIQKHDCFYAFALYDLFLYVSSFSCWFKFLLFMPSRI